MFKINPENYNAKNILSEEQLIEKLKELKKQNKKIGLCTGSFDLLHPGHITHLISAKKVCDVLFVGIAKDYFSSNKYPFSGRPVFNQNTRAFMVAKLSDVDFVFFDDGEIETIKLVKPDVYIKGSDWVDENPGVIATKDFIFSYGGKIHNTPTEKLSTTDIIKHIKEEIK